MRTIIARGLLVGLGVLYLFFLGGFLSSEERNRRRLLHDRRLAVEIFVGENVNPKAESFFALDKNRRRNTDTDIESECRTTELTLVTEFITKNDITGESAMIGSDEPYQGMLLAVPTIMKQEQGKAATLYELTDRVHDELGLIDHYKTDWAYSSVTKTPMYEQEQRKSSKRSFGTTLYNPKYIKSHDKTSFDFFFSWFYFHTIAYLKTSYEHEMLYERVGTAFAGGSHGEVWRARFRCSTSLSIDNHDPIINKIGDCADQSELVMKRLLVGHGKQLLEAGLREIYFGEKLAHDPTSFTQYIDHFYRNENQLLELWIVFKNGGPSLRSFLYTPILSNGYVIFQQSDFWRELRFGILSSKWNSSQKSGGSLVPMNSAHINETEKVRSTNKTDPEGRLLMKQVLSQLLTSTAKLHEQGIVHRDIKPSNILCEQNFISGNSTVIPSISCVLADFSSAYDKFTLNSLFTDGLTPGEITEEYAPPEVLFESEWIPFDYTVPSSYDIWSIGVVALELMLGSPNVFTVDQRTKSVLTNRLLKKGASEKDIERALYLAALSHYCIYLPNGDIADWPLRSGDPLSGTRTTKSSCTLNDFHMALRARDPLGLGFDNATDPLLKLIWRLLALNPRDRISATDALKHEYFTDTMIETSSSWNDPMNGALVSQVTEPKFNDGAMDVSNFTCPQCGKVFHDFNSCTQHARSRKHANFCAYDHSLLPPCISSHSMLPAHPSSGYCDIQGRRPTIEDFHTVVLQANHQFYGVFDGHNGNLASKYAASSLYRIISEKLLYLNNEVQFDWKRRVQADLITAFHKLHTDFSEVAAASPGGVMCRSGTTVTILYITEEYFIVANVGDSRAVLSKGASYDKHIDIASAIQLTVDHIPSNQAEKNRITNLGGTIRSGGGIDRVEGSLAITRSIGDAHLQKFLSHKPFVFALHRDEVKFMCKDGSTKTGANVESTPCFVVLASDGLWDVISNEEAVLMVNDVLQQFGSENEDALQEAAQRLTHEAYIRGSRDNIGVCVVTIL